MSPFCCSMDLHVTDKDREKRAPPWSRFPTLRKKEPQPAHATLLLAAGCFSSSGLRCGLCSFAIGQHAPGLCQALRESQTERSGSDPERAFPSKTFLFSGFLPDSCKLLSDPSANSRSVRGRLDLALPPRM